MKSTYVKIRLNGDRDKYIYCICKEYVTAVWYVHFSHTFGRRLWRPLVVLEF